MLQVAGCDRGVTGKRDPRDLRVAQVHGAPRPAPIRSQGCGLRRRGCVESEDALLEIFCQ